MQYVKHMEFDMPDNDVTVNPVSTLMYYMISYNNRTLRMSEVIDRRTAI